jgi:hypothetical protein
MSTTPFTAAISEIDRLTKELESALLHAKTARGHYTSADVPRACAHLWAAQGHFSHAQHAMSALAELHATKAIP